MFHTTTLKRKKHIGGRGFTLIELVIVVAIIGILSAIAIPSYMYYMRNSRSIEAKTNLSSLAMQLEEYNSLYGRYCPACNVAGVNNYQYKEQADGSIAVPADDTITAWLPDFTPKQATSGGAVRYDYSITATGNPNGTYTVTATPVVVRGVLNQAFTINNTGQKTKAGSNGW